MAITILNVPMRTIYKIRLENAKKIAASFKNRAAFADAIDRQPTQVSRFMGKNPTKPIGDDTAALIEKSLGLEEGFLDRPGPDSEYRGYRNNLYGSASDRQRAIADTVADELLRMPLEEAERLRQAMELLRGPNTRKD